MRDRDTGNTAGLAIGKFFRSRYRYATSTHLRLKPIADGAAADCHARPSGNMPRVTTSCVGAIRYGSGRPIRSSPIPVLRRTPIWTIRSRGFRPTVPYAAGPSPCTIGCAIPAAGTSTFPTATTFLSDFALAGEKREWRSLDQLPAYGLYGAQSDGIPLSPGWE